MPELRVNSADMKLRIALALLLVACAGSHAAWPMDGRFRVEQVNGKPCLVDPAGKPFKSVGLVWAYGPERGPMAHKVDRAKLAAHLQRIKDLGFNTLNLYGNQLIPEMLAWCDENELAVYFRTAYNDIPGMDNAEREFPDHMDPVFREKAKARYAKFLDEVKGHPSVLAIDTDNRWMFPIDWSGAVRADEPKLRGESMKHFPRWLATQYPDVAALNAAWGTAFAAFDDVLRDQRIVRGGSFMPLGEHPWRLDVYRYTLWTQSDFLADLARHLKQVAGDLIVTPTTEHPECIPDTNPRPEDGIAFMSPVHYNKKDDYQRDLPSLGKLIYETRWHYDMQGGPPYVSETGWRTSPLEQNPPNLDYAWMVPQDEEVAARCYAVQFSLLQVLPWVSGFGYFKMYDKVPEGDFGYLRDDGSKKPQAMVGDAINGIFDAAALADPEPEVWIFYPEYAQASHRPGFLQLKSFVRIWERAFLTALYARVDQHWTGLRAGNREAGAAFASDVLDDFHANWRGFAFTKTVPADDKPVLLFSNVAEILSDEDRVALLGKRTIGFGLAGARDLRFAERSPWNIGALNLAEEPNDEHRVASDLETGRVLASPSIRAWLPWHEEPPFSWERAAQARIACQGQALALPRGSYKRLEVLAGSRGGNAAGLCEVEYADGERRALVMGPTITDVRFKPEMTSGERIDGLHYSRLDLPLETGREVVALRLPNDPRIEVAAVALVSGGVASNVMVSLAPSSYGSAHGRTPWLWLLETDDQGRPLANKRLDVLARFANGTPAVVGYGRNVTFLFDPLTAAGKPEEFSRHEDQVRALIDAALSYIEER
jgi:hypothetical protein